MSTRAEDLYAIAESPAIAWRVSGMGIPPLVTATHKV
jgi:hypothetical protein